MINYKIIYENNKNNIYINDIFIGYYIQDDNGINFHSDNENIDITFNEDIFRNILISRIHTFKEFLKYKYNPNWNNLYNLLIYTILYLDYIRNHEETNNKHENELVHIIFNVH
jgi:hypothetical protein